MLLEHLIIYKHKEITPNLKSKLMLNRAKKQNDLQLRVKSQSKIFCNGHLGKKVVYFS